MKIRALLTLKPIAVLLFAAAVCAGTATAQQHLRIGTGGTADTYFPVGVLMAAAVSQPGKIIATAQSSNGSLGNVIRVTSGSLESGLSQADVASWGYHGVGIFEGKPRLLGLRLIANLYPESIHIVVKKGSGIKTIGDLKGKRVALDEAGSGTLVSARQVLGAYGLTESDLQPEYIKPNQAAAASGLQSQAQDLVKVVAVFNLGGNTSQNSLAPRPTAVRAPAATAKGGDDEWETF